MNESTILMSLILDKDMVVTDAPCSGATLIAQHGDAYFAFAITSDGTCVLGLEGEEHVSISIRDLMDLLTKTCGEKKHSGAASLTCLH